MLASRPGGRSPGEVDAGAAGAGGGGAAAGGAPGALGAAGGGGGAGKAPPGRVLLGLEPPTDGEVRFRGTVLRRTRGEEFSRFRRAVQPIFQDSTASLNPPQ